jgi:hypothetical protein
MFNETKYFTTYVKSSLLHNYVHILHDDVHKNSSSSDERSLGNVDERCLINNEWKSIDSSVLLVFVTVEAYTAVCHCYIVQVVMGMK